MNNKDYQYIVRITLNDQTPFTQVIDQQLTIGRNPRSDVVLTDINAPEHLLEINEKHDSLYLKYLGPRRYGYLNQLGLESGQNYFLDVGDVIKAKNYLIEVTEKNLTGASGHSHDFPPKFKIDESGFVLNQSIPPLPQESAAPNIMTLWFMNLKEAIKNRPRKKRVPRQKVVDQKVIDDFEDFDETELIVATPPLRPMELAPLKLYAFFFDFILCSTLIGTILPKFFAKFMSIKFFSETPHYILELAGLETTNSFLYFIIFLLLFNFGQSIVFGSTIGQFIVGLKMDTQNKLSKMFLLRIKTFFFSLFLIPAQNQRRQSLFFKVSRYTLVPLLIITMLALPFILYPTIPSELKTSKILPGPHTTERFYAEQTHHIVLKQDSNTITSSTIENRFYLLMKFEESSQKMSALNFIDLIEDQKIQLSLIRSLPYADLNEILALGNPFFSKTNNGQELKASISYALNFSPKTYLTHLFDHGLLTGASNEIKKLFIPQKDLSQLNITNYTAPKELLSYDTDEYRYYLFFDNSKLHIFRAPIANPKILNSFEEQIFGNMDKNELLPQDENTTESSKGLTLLELFRVNTTQNPSEVLTYYINAVNKVLNSDIVFEREKLNLDIKYLLIKSIESTLEITGVYKDKLALQTLIHKLTPMEMPGEQDE